MEYYMLILNRTFLVLYNPDSIIGIKVNGLVSIENQSDYFTRTITNSLAIKGDLNNPQSYVKEKNILKLKGHDLTDANIKAIDKANFIIQAENLSEIYYDPRKKWGMGYYPHDGKVYVKSKNGSKREFIILGNQSGERIASNLRNNFKL